MPRTALLPPRPLRATAAALAFALTAASCLDGTGPEGTLHLLFDTGTVAPGTNLQLTALDAEGDVAWTSDDPAIATVVGRTGWVTGVARGTTTIHATDDATEAVATIQVKAPPFLRVAQPTATFEAVAGEGDPAPASIAVTNDGDLPLTGLQVGPVAYGVGEVGGWLSAVLTATSAPAELQLAASIQGLAPGTYTATLPVTSSVSVNGPQSVAVTLDVLRPPSIELDRESVELGTTPGDDSSPSLVAVTNGGDRPLTGLQISVDYGSGASGWLSAVLDRTTAPATLTLVAHGASLAQGQYSASVEVASALDGVAPRTISVDLVVAPGPAITLSSTQVDFAAVVGQAPPAQTVQVSNGGGGTLRNLGIGGVLYGTGPGGWLTVTISSVTAPATLTLSVTSGALAEGTYTASFDVASPDADNSPRTIDVTLVVDQAPVIAIAPPNWQFVSIRGQGDAPAQGMQITNAGGGVLSGLSVSVQYHGAASGWLDLTLTSDTGPTSLIGQARFAGLQVGTYTATVTISSNHPGVATVSFPVQYELKWSFKVDIQPYFTTAYGGFGNTPCTNCHVAGGPSPDLSSAAVAYQAIVAGGLVTPGDPDVGRLICKIEGGGGCGSPMRLPPAQVARIRQWIQQGAPF